MEASKITVSDKTYDVQFLKSKKKTDLRRKAIVEYIQSKPSGELIGTGEFQRIGQFTSYANTWSFVKRMIRDGVLSQYKGDKPKTYYYGVTGAARVHKPKVEVSQDQMNSPDINNFIKDMKALGVKFTITIEG